GPSIGAAAGAGHFSTVAVPTWRRPARRPAGRGRPRERPLPPRLRPRRGGSPAGSACPCPRPPCCASRQAGGCHAARPPGPTPTRDTSTPARCVLSLVVGHLPAHATAPG